MGKCIETPLSKEELEELYVNKKLSAIKIGEIKGIKYQQVYYLLNKYKIKRRAYTEMGRVYSVNEEYFDVIDSEEKAYWLGFLYADGYVTSRDCVGLTLKESDVGHLQKFKAALSSNHPIHHYRSSGYSNNYYVRVMFKSSHMVNILQQRGCLAHKSLILKWPTEDQVPTRFLSSFLLGYIDGDGCLTFSDKKHHFLRIKICGTKEFLAGIVNYVNTIISPDKMSFLLEKRHNNRKNTYSITISGNARVKNILDILYNSSPVFLERKWTIFQKAYYMSTVEPIRNDGCLTL